MTPQDHTGREHRIGLHTRLLLLAVSLAVLLPGIFSTSLTDRDEGWYAQVSREMLESGDWLIPRYLGEPWIAKPPLLYWCVAALYALLGQSAGVARLACVLPAVVSVQLVATLAAGLLSRRAAVFAAVSFITAGLPAIVGKMLLTDSLLLMWCLAAMVLLWRIATRRSAFAHCLAFWICIGFGILTKGPAIIVFVGGFGLGLLTRGKLSRWLSRPLFWLTSPAAVLVAGPWYALVAARAGDTLASQFFGYEILSRITGTPHGHGGPPGYYLLFSLAGLLPWTPLVFGAVFELMRDRRREPVAWHLIIWCFAPWAMLELIHSKLPHYILPCYVPLAIMLGRMWDAGLDRPVSRTQRVGLGIWVGVTLLLGVGLTLAGLHWRPLAWTTASIVTGLVIVLAFSAVGWLAWRARLRAAWRLAAVSTIAFHVLLGLWILPGFEPYRLSRNIAARANAIAPPEAAVIVTGYEEPSMFFYLERHAELVRPEDIASRLPAAPEPYVIIATDAAREAAAIPAELQPTEWHRVSGFNYVKARQVDVWLGQTP